MKKLTKSVLAILVVASSITACKKGDDDPGLSLSSRSSRIAGEWKVDSYESATTDVSTNNGLNTVTTETSVNSTKINGATINTSSNVTSTAAGFTSYTESTTGTVSEFTYTIEKDGTWKSKKVTKITSSTKVEAGVSETDAENLTTTVDAEGTWQFLGKNKGAELKNKEAVLLSTAKIVTTTVDISTTGSSDQSTRTETQTFALNELTEVWTLSQLAKKEMVANIQIDSKYDGSTSFTSGSTSTTVKYGPVSTKGTVVVKFSQE
jgi:hypothetical protein